MTRWRSEWYHFFQLFIRTLYWRKAMRSKVTSFLNFRGETLIFAYLTRRYYFLKKGPLHNINNNVNREIFFINNIEQIFSSLANKQHVQFKRLNRYFILSIQLSKIVVRVYSVKLIILPNVFCLDSNDTKSIISNF